MDGDYVRVADEEGNAVQRKVDHAGFQAMQKQGEGQMIQEVGIGLTINGSGKVRRQAGKGALIVRQRYERVFVGLIDGAEGMQQAMDIRANSEIPHAAGVDRDAQAHGPAIKLAPRRPGASRRKGGSAR